MCHISNCTSHHRTQMSCQLAIHVCTPINGSLNIKRWTRNWPTVNYRQTINVVSFRANRCEWNLIRISQALTSRSFDPGRSDKHKIPRKYAATHGFSEINVITKSPKHLLHRNNAWLRFLKVFDVVSKCAKLYTTIILFAGKHSIKSSGTRR